MKRRNLIKNACLMAAATVIPVQAATKPFDPMEIPWFKEVINNISRRNEINKETGINHCRDGFYMFGEVTESKRIILSSVSCYFNIPPNYLISQKSFCSVRKNKKGKFFSYIYDRKATPFELAQLNRYSLEKQLSFR